MRSSRRCNRSFPPNRLLSAPACTTAPERRAMVIVGVCGTRSRMFAVLPNVTTTPHRWSALQTAAVRGMHQLRSAMRCFVQTMSLLPHAHKIRVAIGILRHVCRGHVVHTLHLRLAPQTAAVFGMRQPQSAIHFFAETILVMRHVQQIKNVTGTVRRVLV